MKRELFISKQGALKAIVNLGLKRGLPADLICKKGKVYPVLKRGQVLGYNAFVPANSTAIEPIMEAQL